METVLGQIRHMHVKINASDILVDNTPILMRLFTNCPANIFFQVSSGFLPGFLPFFCRSRHVIGMCERVLFCRVVAALPGFLPIFFRAEAYMTMSEGFRKKTR